MADKSKQDQYKDKPFSAFGAADKIKQRKKRMQDELDKLFGKHHTPGTTSKVVRGN